MSKLGRPELPQPAPDNGAKPDLISGVVRVLLTKIQPTSSRKVCVNCGSTSDLREGVISLWGAGKTWDIPLLFCETCVSELRVCSVRFQFEYESTGAADSRAKGVRVQGTRKSGKNCTCSRRWKWMGRKFRNESPLCGTRSKGGYKTWSKAVTITQRKII